MRTISLVISLFCFWLLLSGNFSFDHKILFAFAALSIGICVFIAHRMHLLDEEGHPVHLIRGAITYMPWLLNEIFKSAWFVTKIIMRRKMPISPQMFVVRAGQKTDVAVNVYANSITLTPGTMTVGVKGHDLFIHALTQETAEDLKSGGMDARVTKFEGA